MTASGAEPDFDVVVIGGGIAGSVSAYRLALAGHQVALVERGENAGAKNLSGGVLYSRVMEQVFPGFLDEAPVERRVTRNVVQFINPDSSVAIDYSDRRLAEPTNAVTVLRGKLDPWLAEKCEEAGVMLMPGLRVDSLVVEDGVVVGIETAGEQLRSRVVVAADGVNSFLTRDAGLREKPAQNQLAVGVKAVLSLPADVIEQRFSCSADEGVAYAMVGDCTQGVGGGGFLYTNRDSLSVGVVLRIDDLVASKRSSTDVFDHFVQHPMVAPLLEGGETVEYGCHMVAEGGLAMMGDIVFDGLVVVGDAAGLTLNTGLTVRGMDLAAASGIAAADAIDAALKAGDTSRVGLSAYESALMESFAGQDMKTYRRAPEFLETPRLYTQYGKLLADVLHGAFAHDLTPRRHLVRVAWDALKGSGITVRQLAADAWKGVRAL